MGDQISCYACHQPLDEIIYTDDDGNQYHDECSAKSRTLWDDDRDDRQEQMAEDEYLKLQGL